MFTRLIAIPEDDPGENTFSFEELKQGVVWLEQLIAANLDLLFPGQRISGLSIQNHTRCSLGFDEDGDKDLLTAVKQKSVGTILGRSDLRPIYMPPRVSDILLKNLDLTAPFMFRSSAPLGLSSLVKLAQINRPELKYEPSEPKKHSQLANREKIFSTLKKRDVLLYHPYDSFESVIDFVEERLMTRFLAIKNDLKQG